MRRRTLPLLICAAVAAGGCYGTALYGTEGYYDGASYGVAVTYPYAYPPYYSSYYSAYPHYRSYPYYRTYPYYRSYPHYRHVPYYGHAHRHDGYHARSHYTHGPRGYRPAPRAAPHSHRGSYPGHVRDHR